MNIRGLSTEQVNERTAQIDELSSLEIAKAINEEDATVALAVEKELPKIAQLIDWGVEALENDGRVFYVGAGTSGRLGVLDASEIPPTYNVSSDKFIGIIAGGMDALTNAKPSHEDNALAGQETIEKYQITSNDLIIGLSASGTAQFVAGALRFVKTVNAKTAVIACNKGTMIGKLADLAIEVETGPEVILGSTRMKAGTAQKMVLNIFSTGTMIRLGKVYKNYMVDFSTNNEKLFNRAIQIIMDVSGLSRDEAIEVYQKAGSVTKNAIVMAITGASLKDIQQGLEKHGGNVSALIKELS